MFSLYKNQIQDELPYQINLYLVSDYSAIKVESDLGLTYRIFFLSFFFKKLIEKQVPFYCYEALPPFF